MKPVVIDDIFSRKVFPGQLVGVLVAEHKMYYPKAYLCIATYLGKGRYGYEFSVRGLNREYVVRIRQPRVVRK